MREIINIQNEYTGPEILAPAGSLDALRAGLGAGADAVYMGGSRFGARAYAQNADTQEMIEALHIVHRHGKKLYMTVNTLLKDHELAEELVRFIRPFYEEGLDAVIVQDFGVLSVIAKEFKDLDIHLSTQMCITDANALKLFYEPAITRVVPARELSIDEIKKIKALKRYEVETFVHGALCYSYSGRCLMSSMIGGRSGNRGRCAGPCRQTYHVKDDSYVLSMKDICTIDILEKLIDAEIDSFKIEGRMKSPEYVAETVSAYRHVTDKILASGKCEDKEKIRRELAEVYNRGGFSNGYYISYHGSDMMWPKRPNHTGTNVAVASDVKKGNVVMKPVSGERVGAGDVLEIRDESGSTDKAFEFTVGERMLVEQANNRDHSYSVKVHTDFIIKPGMNVYRTKNASLLERIGKDYPKDREKSSISGDFNAYYGSPISLTVVKKTPFGDIYHTEFGETPDKAQKTATSEADVKKQLEKTGESIYFFEKLSMSMEQDLFIPVKWLNELRRNAMAALAAKCEEAYKRTDLCIHDIVSEDDIKLYSDKCTKEKLLVSVLVSDAEQAKVVISDDEVDEIIFDFHEIPSETVVDLGKTARNNNKKYGFAFPEIFREKGYNRFKEKKEFIEKLEPDFFLVRNLEAVYFIKNELKTSDSFIRADHTLYVTNSESSEYLKKFGIRGITYSHELNKGELTELSEKLAETETDLIVYGRAPLMYTANCVRNNVYGCNKQKEVITVTDKQKEDFKVKCVCDFCYNIVYNGKIMKLYDLDNDIRTIEPTRKRLEFTLEDAEEVKNILNDMKHHRDMDYKSNAISSQSLTRGHFNRGVE